MSSIDLTATKSASNSNAGNCTAKGLCNAKETKKTPLSTHLIAGGGAGFIEAVVCHPLDTVKVRMQLRVKADSKAVQSANGVNNTTAHAKRRIGPLGTTIRIVKYEGAPALYKGLSAVVTAIVPKMAIRFSSFELYKRWLQDPQGKVTTANTFIAGLGAGITESVLVVNPMEVTKIRLQAQRHSLADPLDIPKYRNAGHAMYTIVREEGPLALYKGVTLTAARQATNQAVNFTVYQEMKRQLLRIQEVSELPSWQHLLAGGISGALAPLANAPIDTVKTRVQRQPAKPGETATKQILTCVANIWRNEGFAAFYQGLTPRLLRIAPGQAITFMVYERLAKLLNETRLAQTPNPSDKSLD